MCPENGVTYLSGRTFGRLFQQFAVVHVGRIGVRDVTKSPRKANTILRYQRRWGSICDCIRGCIEDGLKADDCTTRTQSYLANQLPFALSPGEALAQADARP